jgi:hypothetical protein
MLTKNDIKYYNYVNNHPFDNRKYPQYTFTINHYTVSLKKNYRTSGGNSI